MLGLGLFLPVMNYLATDQIPQWASITLGGVNLYNKEQIATFVIGLLCVFFILKNVILTFLTYQIHRLIGDLRFYISKRMFERYINSEYSDLMLYSSSTIIKNLTTMISNLNTYVLVQGGIFLTECFVLAALVMLALILMPLQSSLLFSFIFIPSYMYFAFTKKRIARYGVETNSNEAIRVEHVHDMVGSIRDIQLLNKRKFFIDRYDQSNFSVTQHSFKVSFMTQSTKYVLESILIFSMTTLIFLQVMQGASMLELIPILGFYAIAGFRIIPSVNRLIIAVQSIKFGEDILKTINENLTVNSAVKNVQPQQTLSFLNDIHINNLGFSYPGLVSQVLKKVNIKIAKGEAIGVCGETGSGKSTLLNILLGFLKPSSGVITIDDVDIHQEHTNLSQVLGFVPQDIFLLDDSIANNIAFGVPADLIDFSKLDQAIKEAGLESFIKKAKFGIDTPVGERGIQISGGQRQRIGIARAFYFGAEILVFDEATSALDEKTERLIMQNIRRLKGRYTLFIVAHRLSTLSLCDRVYELKDGRTKRFKLDQ